MSLLLRRRVNPGHQPPPWARSPVGRDMATLADILLFWADVRPDDQAYGFVSEGESITSSISYGALSARVLSLSAEIQKVAQIGDRALLMYPPGLDFVEAFFACLHASVIAVPIYPPRNNRHSARLSAVASDCQASLVLTDKITAKKVREFGDASARYCASILETDDLNGNPSTLSVRRKSDGVAFLQYTSGSTGTPKGVMVSNSNLLNNIGDLCAGSGTTDQDRFLSWLPLFHDMGLIAGGLQPMYWGVPSVLMAPAQFLQDPMSWLRAISRHRATKSGAPNFAYALCTKAAKNGARIDDLDLSSWKIAWNGAEPIRPEILNEFSDTFMLCGFSSSSHFPCYGLAEATLYVSSGIAFEGVRTVNVDADSLQRGVINVPHDNRRAHSLASCGPAQGADIVIVDPNAMTLCEEGRVGEVWIRGPGIASGYWNRPDATSQTFGLSIDRDLMSGFMRTGDLGFIYKNELVVAGRLKDTIIVRGRNLFPHDLEDAICGSFAFVRPNTCAVVQYPPNGDSLGIVVELDRATAKALSQTTDRRASDELACAVAATVAAEAGVRVSAVGFARPGAFPRTSSGKVQRSHCARLLREPDDSIEFVWTSPSVVGMPLGGSTEVAVEPATSIALNEVIKAVEESAFPPS